ncbi:MAG: RNA polymerase sigma-70 factor (ECF subfamily) [Ilumatobacter sp.]|jgi:RNA polymerase sigma-70 factor (ECF subfamily)
MSPGDTHAPGSSQAEESSETVHPPAGLPRRNDVRLEFAEASDAALVVSISRYEQSALAEAYRRNAGAVYGLAKRLLSDHARAEEIVQEVFVRLWNSPERFDPDRGTLRSFLLAQTHGRSVDMIRSDVARRKREERESLEQAEGGYDLAREVWDMALAGHVREALEVLTPAERAAIELAYFGGRTYREAAEELGEAEGTVKSRIRVGLKRLRSELSTVGIANGVE